MTHVLPMLTPAVQGEGNYTFYREGITAFLEREIQSAEQKLRLAPEASANISPCEEEEDDTDFESIMAELMYEMENEGGGNESSNDHPV